MKEKNKTYWKQVLKQAKELENVKIVACSNMLDLFNIKEEELDKELVDEIVGIATMSRLQLRRKQIYLFNS